MRDRTKTPAACAHCADRRHGGYETAERRWAGLGPYYAMFPAAFADATVLRYSEPGDSVLDPFAGRGTSIFSAAIHDRVGVGIELHAVGWVYARTKLHPAPERRVLERLHWIGRMASAYDDGLRGLPPFFTAAFSAPVRRFLLAARDNLDWRSDRVDRTLMALLLVSLHGKTGAALSNQMRQTKAMSPEYAISWWAEREMRPPRLDPVTFMEPKVAWRYVHGVPNTRRSVIRRGDSTRVLAALRGTMSRAQLLFTSPPYYGVTNYHYDQWLRLWLLGGPPTAARQPRGPHAGKFSDQVVYRSLLTRVFAQSARLCRKDAAVYVRTSEEPVTYRATHAALRAAFPGHEIVRRNRPVEHNQTRLFGQASARGEVDLVLRPA